MNLIAVVELTIFIPLVLIGIGVGVVIWLTSIYEKKRTEKLSAVADELGLTFQAEEDDQILSKLQFLPVFNRGRKRKMKNVMSAETESTKLAIFDYQFTTGSGKHQHTHKFTIASMEKESLELPYFSVRPEGFFDRLGSVVGFQDINFADHPAFSRAFVLKGENEVAIRSFFTKFMLDLFTQKKDAMVEAGGSVVTFRRRGRQSPEQISDFMAEAYDFLNAFENSGSSEATT